VKRFFGKGRGANRAPQAESGRSSGTGLRRAESVRLQRSDSPKAEVAGLGRRHAPPEIAAAAL